MMRTNKWNIKDNARAFLNQYILVIMKINSQQLKALDEKNEVEVYSFSTIQNNYYIHLMN